MEFVSIDVTDGVATIRLDRPKMNAISVQVQADLREAAAEVTERDDVRAVVLWGGERVFAAGNDVKEMADLSYADMVKVSASVSSATLAIARIPKPVVAAVNGYALGGGCELALSADLRFAADNAVFGQPEVLLGIIPGAGGTQRLSRLVGPSRAKDIIFTGRFVKADEALRIGLVDRVVPADQVLDEALTWARQFSGAAAWPYGPPRSASTGGARSTSTRPWRWSASSSRQSSRPRTVSTGWRRSLRTDRARRPSSGADRRTPTRGTQSRELAWPVLTPTRPTRSAGQEQLWRRSGPAWPTWSGCSARCARSSSRRAR